MVPETINDTYYRARHPWEEMRPFLSAVEAGGDVAPKQVLTIFYAARDLAITLRVARRVMEARNDAHRAILDLVAQRVQPTTDRKLAALRFLRQTAAQARAARRFRNSVHHWLRVTVRKKAIARRATRNTCHADIVANINPVAHEASRRRIHHNNIQAALCEVAQRAFHQSAEQGTALRRLRAIAAAARDQLARRNSTFDATVVKVAVIREATEAAWWVRLPPTRAHALSTAATAPALSHTRAHSLTTHPASLPPRRSPRPQVRAGADRAEARA